MPIQKYLPCAIAIAWMVVTPAFASDRTWTTWAPQALPDNTAALLGYHGAGAYEATGSTAPLAPSPYFANWSGFYIGGQFGYSDANADFSKSTQALIAYSLRELTLESEFSPSNWPVLGTANHGAAGFGGFVGYNFQYERGILGIEANYEQANLSLTAPNSPISRVTPADSSANGNVYTVNITGSGTVTDLDYGTLRARGGWAVNNFLPYAFVGVAIGNANVNVTETTSGVQTPTLCGGAACVPPATPPAPTPFSFAGTAGHNSEWLYGVTAGVGLDVALTRNIFVRAEYEYVQFAPVASTIVSINTARVGAGIKF